MRLGAGHLGVVVALLGTALAGIPTATGAQVASATGGASYTTAGTHSFEVPCGVDTLTVDAYGARGGLGDNFGFGGTNTGGLGGRAQGDVAVTPGETLAVVVGGHGGDVELPAPLNVGGAGGVNGGGTGGSQTTGAGFGGGGGGGMSNVDRDATHLVVAGGGGGGGGGSGFDRAGGAGGGTGTNGHYSGAPALGGRSGGNGGAGGDTALAPPSGDGTPGSAGQGGNGATGTSLGGGGGGGAGALGGGGGARESGENGAGGGGGSGLVPAGGTTTDGVDASNGGDGKVLLSYTQGPCTTTTSCDDVLLSTSAGFVEDLAAEPVPATPAPPDGVALPCDLLSFRVTDLTPGETITATFTTPVAVDEWYKLEDGAYTRLDATVSAGSISVELTDGGTGDSDGVADGVIVDPSALAQVVPPPDPPDPPLPGPTPAPVVVAGPTFTG